MTEFSREFQRIYEASYAQSLDKVTSDNFAGRLQRMGRATLGKWRFEISDPRAKYFQKHRADHAQVYAWLNDESSRRLLLTLFMARLFGYKSVNLPILPEKQAETRTYALDKLCRETHTLPTQSDIITSHLDKFDLSPLDIPLTLHSHANLVTEIFMFRQYRYAAGTTVIDIRSGDVVIDAGACWGDTALYFAHLAGASGSIHAFEFVDANLEIMSANFELNPAVKARIQVVEKALWDHDDVQLSFNADGVKSMIATTGEDKVSTQTIDTYVRTQGLSSVDFIKMDIEGAELPALRGAVETIRRFKPRLAIAVYHAPEDIFAIPQYIKSLVPDYRLYLGHYTPTRAETILFAEC